MNIGIDAGAISVSDSRLKTGVYQVTSHLLREFSKLDKTNKFWLYSFLPIPQQILQILGSNFQNKILKPHFGWINFRLSLEMLLDKPDIFVGINQALPFFLSKKSIAMIHDIAFELFPESYPNSYNRLHFLTKRAVKKAGKIITFSQAVKKDLINAYEINERNIKVIPEGIDSIFQPQSAKKILAIKNKYQLNKSYILSVGSIKPIKNISGILDVYKKLPAKIQQKYQLVLVGSDFWAGKDLQKRITDLKENNRIKYLGFIPENDLPALYSGAEVLLSPSFYEGFGLPLLEAMACGCPVISGKNGSAPEVVGNAGFLVDPKNIEEIKQKLELVLTRKLINQELRHKSFMQAKKFNLEKFGKEVYNEIIRLNKKSI